FYRRVHPTVYGWRPIAKLLPQMSEVRDIGGNAFLWAMGCVSVYSALFGIGKLIFEEWLIGCGLLALAAFAGYLIFWDLSRRGWQAFSGPRQISDMSFGNSGSLADSRSETGAIEAPRSRTPSIP